MVFLEKKIRKICFHKKSRHLRRRISYGIFLTKEYFVGRLFKWNLLLLLMESSKIRRGVGNENVCADRYRFGSKKFN